MVDYTRRTHVVRIKGGGGFVDVEVLDAISFTRQNGKEVVLNCNAKKAVPYIVDNTGSGNGKTPGRSTATRRTHMKKITGLGAQSNQFFYVEVLDAAAFSDESGGEWILKFNPDAPSFNVTDGTGDSRATRRTHNEKISTDLTVRKPSRYLTVERSDIISLRAPNGKEVILKAASSDDPLNLKVPRASTFMTPSNYNPTNKDGPTPPTNSDPCVYVAFPKEGKGGGPFTGDVKISQGPMWWIRNVGGSQIAVIEFQITAISQNNGTTYPVNCDIRLQLPGDDTYYNMQTSFAAGFVPTPGNPEPPAITTTITPGMLQLTAWSYTPSSVSTVTTEETEFSGWIIDSATWNTSYITSSGARFPYAQFEDTTAPDAHFRAAELWNQQLPLGPGFRATPPDYPEIFEEPLGGFYPPDPIFFNNGGVAHIGTIIVTTYFTTKVVNGLVFVNLSKMPPSTRPSAAPPPSPSDVAGLPQFKVFSSAFDPTSTNPSVLIQQTGLGVLTYNNETEFPFAAANKAGWAYSPGPPPKYLPQARYLAPFTNADATLNIAYDGFGDGQAHNYSVYTLSFDQRAADPTFNLFGKSETIEGPPPFPPPT